MNDGERRKRGFHDGAELFKTFDFAIESAVSDGKKQAFRHAIARGLPPVSCHQSDLVGRADAETFSDSTTGHPDRKSSGVMLSAHISLFHRCPTEFACPDDQGRIEESALFQVRQESCDTDVGPFGWGVWFSVSFACASQPSLSGMS